MPKKDIIEIGPIPKKKRKLEKAKWKKLTVYTPSDFDPSLFPDDCVPLTYDMVCRILHIKKRTLHRKIQLKHIKTMGTNPGCILLSELKKYIQNTVKKRLTRPKLNVGFRAFPENGYYAKNPHKRKGKRVFGEDGGYEDGKQGVYNPDDDLYAENVYSPNSIRYDKDGKLKPQEI